MRVFVAGHKGLVGSAVVRNCPSDVEIFKQNKETLDLRDRQALIGYLKKNKIESVIIAAAKVGGIEANNTYQSSFLLENLELQNSIISASLSCEVPNLVFLGSSCVYPKYAKQPIGEESLLTGNLEPTNEGYAVAKIAGVTLCKAISKETNYNYFSLMPTNLYGPNDNFSTTSSHVPAALLRRFHESKIMNSPNVSVWGTGKVKREFMHVDDLAAAIWFLQRKNLSGELINVGTGEDITIIDFAKMISNIVGYKGEIMFDATKPEGSPRKLLNVEKVHSLGWNHKIELEQGLISTYEWFKNALKNGEVRGG